MWKLKYIQPLKSEEESLQQEKPSPKTRKRGNANITNLIVSLFHKLLIVAVQSLWKKQNKTPQNPPWSVRNPAAGCCSWCFWLLE